jgi:hypothetical protein
MTTAGRYAVLFKAFAMDDFVSRRLARVVAASPGGDVFLMMDETKGGVGPIAFDHVIRYTESEVLGLGYPPITHGSLFWYNADYPLYYFQELYPDYDVIVMVEYDAVPAMGLDDLVRECREQGVDLVGHSIPKTADAYCWTSTMLRYYAPADVRPYQICAAVLSARAVRHLAQCRLRQGRGYDLPDAKQWPIGEAFIGTELASAGFHLREMSSFSALTGYDWWPPIHESELADYAGQVFVHPVLCGRRYLRLRRDRRGKVCPTNPAAYDPSLSRRDDRAPLAPCHGSDAPVNTPRRVSFRN